ncbi:MAG: TetR family transcriptional regulator [Lachnospiraceae bacterium]|mgnify:CR=1 FL=1|nr:TetR family transcriptional regulator [Lachnospiraceae bacterium]
MTGQKETTDLLLAESFKELACRQPIEKITIKAITEKAGVIRPTFYNHFQDKYELLEWIIKVQILEPTRPLIQAGLVDEALLLVFTSVKKEKEFYEKAVRLEGQNSFEMITRTCIGELLLEVIQGKKPSLHRQHPWLTPEHIALFYAQSMSFVVIQWIKSGMEVEPREITDIYNYMITRSMSQVMEEL